MRRCLIVNKPVALFPVAFVIVGCASQGAYLPERTLVLGEVMNVMTQAQVETGELGHDSKVKDLANKMRTQGFTIEQVDSNRVVVVREGIYWNNSVSGIKRDMLRPALIENGLTVNAGNIIEVTTGTKPPTITRVRADNLQSGSCYYDELPTGLVKGLMGIVSMVGPSGAATLYCKGIESEGWQRPRTFWHKLLNQ
jgi:hypothetical protein